MNHKTKRILTLIMLAAMLLSLPVIGASAADEEPTGGGTTAVPSATASTPMPPLKDLTLTAYRKGEATVMKDIANANVVIDLYLIAAAEEDTAHGATFKFGTPNEKSGITAAQLAYDSLPKSTCPEAEAAAYWEKIRSAATKAILPTGAPAYAATVSGAAADQAIEDLAGGLYLIVARDGSTTAKYSDYRDENDAGEVITRAYSDLHVYTYLPQLVVLPGTEKGSTAGAKWVDPFAVYMKPEESDRFGNVTVVKNVDGLQPGYQVSFSFRVTAQDKNKVIIFEEYYMITLPGKNSFDIDGKIPVGATVTVEEVDDGANYTGGMLAPVSQVVPVPIDADGNRQAITFTAYDEHDDVVVNGYGVENTFKMNANGTWDWYKNGVLQSSPQGGAN